MSPDTPCTRIFLLCMSAPRTDLTEQKYGDEMTAREMMIMMMIAKTVWTFGGTRLKLLQDASCFTIFIGFFHSSHQQESAVGGSVCVPVSAIVEVTIHMPDFFFRFAKIVFCSTSFIFLFSLNGKKGR